MNYRELSKIFLSSHIAKLANGDISKIAEVANEHSELHNAATWSDVFEETYKLLSKHYPNEYVVKNIIVNNIFLGAHSPRTTSMLSELRIGANVADCVIINGHSTCYEIKTQFDSLKRLSEQLRAYTSVFDKTYVVIHANHYESVLKMYHANPIFGILVIGERNRLSKKVPAPEIIGFDSEVAFNTLRKEEYTKVIEIVTGQAPIFSSPYMFNECKKIFCSLSPEEANLYFKQVLKKYRCNDSDFIKVLPKSLKNVGVSCSVSSKAKSNLVRCLKGCIQ